MKETAILETKKKDQFLIDPRLIEIQENFNGREIFDRAELDQLKTSIRSEGVQVPILVKRVKGEDKFILINGERRLRVCQELVEEGVEIRIPATIFTGNDTDAIISMLITNDGVRLSLPEEAVVISRLFKYELTEKEIRSRTGRTAAQIANLKVLMEAPQRVKKLIMDGMISSTMVSKILKEHKNYPELGIKLIESSIEFANLSGKNKVTEKTINKVANKINSFLELKKVIKDLPVEVPGNKDLLKFAKKLVANELTKEQIEKMLFI